MRRNRSKRLWAVIMAAAMTVSMCPANTYAVENEPAGSDSDSFSYEKMDADEVTAQIVNAGKETAEVEEAYNTADQEARVMIVLEDAAAISLLDDSEEEIADNEELKEYRENLYEVQVEVAERISDEVLDGEPLDVVWNLTLATNAISANVEYGQIEKIEEVDGVKAVYVETQYDPMKEASTDNIVAQEMTGADRVKYESGYTGAGTRVAIVDTGTDSDHQSFAADGYEYSLLLQAEEKGVSYDEYVESLNLLTEEELEKVLPQLNSYSRYEGLTAENLYLDSKNPYAFNYVDNNLEITHDKDNMGEHGSHVAGITTANTYIKAEGPEQYDFDGDGDFDRDDAQALMDAAIKATAISHEGNGDFNHDGAITAYDVHMLLLALKEYENSGNVYADAENTVGVTGVAPDAQLLTMKVFGKAGGAYSSDYMAAVEDAILLGCDVVNLSLGGANPGYVTAHEDSVAISAYIDGVMEAISETGIVMCVAAGNSGNWADNDDAFQLMYTDETGTFNNSDPSTYTNSLAVASADNVGAVSTSKTVFTAKDGSGSFEAGVEDVADGVNASWKTLDEEETGKEYDVVFLGDPTNLFAGEEQTDTRIYGGSVDDFAGCDFTGKIVLIARGNMVYFSDKHANGAAAGAAAVIIYNNEEGSLNASIEGSEAVIPCGGMTMAEAKEIFALCEKDENGAYTAKANVKSGLNVNHGEDVEYPSMSDFSSWGPTGALTIKPEITAPGGAIYSVNGALEETDGYELMSGTSMATPHIAGLTALADQYVKETGLLEKAQAVSGNKDLSIRNLVQSMLMSTATPLIEESSKVEYSVRNQGAGLASIDKLVEADSFILVEGQEDGKVKAEFGDGGENGWSFTFTIHNLAAEERVYDLDASILTTGTAEEKQDGKTYQLSTDEMTALGAKVTYTGEYVKDSKAVVAANGSTKITVSVKVEDEAVKAMEALGYTNGFYVEGYVYIRPETEGDSEHSIPMLGWYGNWTDPSMYDTGSFLDIAFGTAERPSHIDSETKNLLTWCEEGDDRGNYYTGNIYGAYFYGLMIGDERYIEARNAINSKGEGRFGIYAIFPTLIRTVADFRIEVRDAKDGTLYFVDNYEDVLDRSLIPCFYYTNYQQWYDTTADYGIGVEWDYTDMNGKVLPEDTEVTISVVCAPEYYVNKDGSVRWDELGKGAALSYNFRIDNTAPDLVDEISYTDQTLSLTVQDNNYIAAVALLNGTATEAADYYYPDMDEDLRGTEVSASFDMEDYIAKYGNKAVIAICDYAGNETYYAINLGGEGTAYGEFVGFQYDDEGYGQNAWVSFDQNVNENESRLFLSNTEFVCAEYVNGYVFAQTNSGDMYAIPYEDMLKNTVDLESTFVKRMNNVYQDLAYNYSDGRMYGLNIYEDADGYPTSTIFAFDMDGWSAFDDDPYDAWIVERGGVTGLGLACDDNGILYMLANEKNEETGEDSNAELWKCEAEDNGWYISYGAFQKIGDTGLKMDYLQSMTWNHNSETIYWSRFYPVGFMNIATELIEINPETAACTKAGTLSAETGCLFAPLTAETAAKDKHQNVPAFDRTKAGKPIVSTMNLSLNVGGTAQLSCDFDPWYTAYKEVTWSSDNEGVATVDQNGLVTAIGNGSCTITVASKEDPSLYTECSVAVATLSLEMNGITTQQGDGIGVTGGVYLYNYAMNEGQPSMTLGNVITPGEYDGFGLNMATSTEARGSIWACEYGNTGMIYEIDKETGVVKDMLYPIDGDMMFGLSYSEATDNFTGIMNFYLYVDQPLTHDVEEEMMDSYDPEQYAFTWHKFDMSQYLDASKGNLVTNEEGKTSIVFCGVTNLDNDDETSYYLYQDYLGNYSMSGEVNYTPDTTIVLLDNAGRLWYIDEICGLTASNEYGSTYYMDAEGKNFIPASFNGVFAQSYADGKYSVFVIRKLEETPLYDMFLNGSMPGITYTFSSLYATRDEATGRPIFFLSLYDYWNEGTTNQLYLYVPGLESWGCKMTPDALYDLGDSGAGNIITTINSAKVTGGLVLDNGDDEGDDWYGRKASTYYIGAYENK